VDTNVLIDFWVLDAEPILARLLEGEGWTTAFVDQEFFDPDDGIGRAVADVFPFVEVDPVDARLLSNIQRDQLAIVGASRAASGGAAGEASLVHVARTSRRGSIVLSNDTHAVRLGIRHGISVRGTLYLFHLAFLSDLLSSGEAWTQYRQLQDQERRPPRLSQAELKRYLATGTDPRR
jgi:predicted nucleic acid-binding protein